LQPPGLAGLAGASGLLALSGALGAQAQLLAKDERGGHDAEHRGERGPARAATGLCPSSLVLPNGDRARAIADYLSSSKKRKVEDKDFGTDYGSDADKSEDNLVVDEDPASPRSVHSYSSRENGAEKAAPGRKEAAPPSPTSLASSSSASPSRGRDTVSGAAVGDAGRPCQTHGVTVAPLQQADKSSTPSLKPGTPTSQDAAVGASSAAPQFR
ncbi:TLE1 protein, partial [Nothoprocta ornata]|nr:TLE1 protein [Nothoprocta ornata]